MSLQAECEILQTIPLFRNVDAAKRKLVAMSSERLTYQAGDIVFAENDVSDAVYLMLGGRVKVTRQTEETAVELAELSGGSLIGETGVICGRRRSATIVAVEETTMLRIERQVFLELLEQVPRVALELARELADRVEASNRRLIELTGAT